jgi:hypothetical protein
LVLPPCEFVATLVELAMVSATERNGEFVAGFAPERTLLRKPEVILKLRRTVSTYRLPGWRTRLRVSLQGWGPMLLNALGCGNG